MPPTLPPARAGVDPLAAGTEHAAELVRFAASQELIREVVKGFLHVGAGDVDAMIDDALARLGSFLEVDRTYIFRVDGVSMGNSHEWCAPGVAPERKHLQGVPLSTYGAWIKPLIAGEPVVIDDVEALGPDRSSERDHLSGQGIRSLLVVPMLALGEFVGLVGFEAATNHRRFAASEVGLLRSLADVLTAVLVRQRSDEKSARAEQRRAALTTYSTDVVLIVGGDDQRIRYASRSWNSFGISADAMVGSAWQDYVHPADVGAITRSTRPLVEHRVAERVIRLPDFRVRVPGGWRWFAGSVSDARHDGAVEGLVVNAHDVTDRRTAQEQLAHDALHDPLTGLGNRTLLTERLQEMCDRAAHDDATVALVFLDLDRFKLVNDGHGHAIGDQVLVEVAQRLARVVRSGDTVARFGGDEFVVLIGSADDLDEIDRLIKRLELALDPPVEVKGNRYRVTASMGVVVARGEVLEPVALLRDADTAMYRAKENGRGRAVVFDDPLRSKILRRLTLMHRIPAALEAESVEMEFQPIVDLRTGRVIGAESFARLTDDVLGVVTPSELVTTSEENGLVARVSEVLIDQALSALAAWPAHLFVSVNLSFAQLTESSLIRQLTIALDRHDIDPSRLWIEVTESSLMHDQTNAVWALSLLHEMGVKTALDDFGTGYSSLAVLRELPVDVLKVDRAFVRGVHRDDRDRRLVDAVIGIAHDFGMDTLAEGVENREQQAALVAAGCSLAQGFLYGRPQAAAEFTRSAWADATTWKALPIDP